MSDRLKAHASILFANIIYGINYTVVKEIVPAHMKPLALVLLRVIGASLLFWLLTIFSINEKIEKRDFRILILGGVFGVAVNQMLFIKGLSLSTPINASIIMTSNPILVLLLGAIILHERITLYKMAGIIIGATGALLIILSSGNISFKADLFTGNVYIFINALSYGAYLVLIKPLMKKYKPITVIKWVFTFGFFIVFPFGAKPLFNVSFFAIPTIVYYAIAFVLIGSTFMAYLLNIYGLKSLSPTTVSIYIYSQPILASLVAVVARKDKITIIEIIATLLVFTGVYMVSKKTGLK